ncbi:glutathione S-transferase [Methylobacterium sp. C25]|uniref:glutathione S-transferase family protein n=1 Tax=Methylobacterium sp. C25 TaxID=2721622 RepID=UPI001F254298|nr:glutathione S-transferase [Methylobacterium sp. C25]MCE4222932.1 glutathione S-transferase [Methylobacterium sp. C25]
MKLYFAPLSGHAHRAHLFLSLAGIPHELVVLNLAQGEHKTESFLKLNRLGQVPVLVDGDVVVPDSIAIMVYAAKKFGKTDWLPEDPAEAATVQRWLSISTGQIFNGPCMARLITLFGAKSNPPEAIERAHAILEVIDAELAERDWIALSRPTAADAACYSYIANAPEGDVDLSGYANVLAWLKRVEALPGFVPFQQSRVGLRA